MEVVTKALAANSLGEFTQQSFADPLLRAVERPYFGRPHVRRCIPGPGPHETDRAAGAAGCPISHARPAGHDGHSFSL